MNGLFVIAFTAALAGWFALSCWIGRVLGRASRRYPTIDREED